jgi:hypothetical protein
VGIDELGQYDTTEGLADMVHRARAVQAKNSQ